MRLLVAAAAILFLAAPALAETNVGVTAAVNQSASGTVGSNVRTISLGDSVIYDERIQTGGDGLVQILLADGTTFMVGPNSDLVIDSFVYDPNAGTAQVTASFTKGVLRFIGGQTSKTEGGVTLNTPVGTMGIRGAMVDVVLDPPAGTPQHIDMLFGNEVTLEQGQQLLGRLYAAGYSLVLGEGGAFEVMKTPPGWGSQIQAALAGRPGTKGGAPRGPTEDEVGESEFAENNQPDDPPGLTDKELDQLLEAAAKYDELRPYLGKPTIAQGFAGGMLAGSGFGVEGSLPSIPAYDPETDEAIKAEVAFAPNGDPIGIAMALSTPSCQNCSLFLYDSTTGDIAISNGETSLELNVTSASIREANDTDRQNLGLDCACDFVRWGFWSVEAEGTYEGNDISIDVSNGTWVTGDVTTPEELETVVGTADWETTYATYSGDMVGTVTGGDVASGSFDMDWNFGYGQGSITGEFDGHGFSSGLESVEGSSGGGFYGGDEGSAFEGAFVNNGDELAGGVAGGFALDDGYGWSASGIFMGVRGENGYPH